jgi:GT2 family glycosyltransferase
MRVLAHIHTMNDAAVIEQVLDALRRQTRPPDAILIVDNASSDGTLDRAFPEDVEIVQNPLNLGTSGAVHIGLSYALEHEFDWAWIFDADSVPGPDVLENLLAFFERLAGAKREQVCFLGCWPLTSTGGVKVGPIAFDGSELKYLSPSGSGCFTRCDCTLWSGSLYRMVAVARIGLPSVDYVLDVGEVEYGYRARQLGFISYLVHNAVIHHDVGRKPGSAGRLPGSGPGRSDSTDYVPARCYYLARNWIYFWLYQYTPRETRRALRAIVRSIVFSLRFAVRPMSYRLQLTACMRGIRDGLTMHMERRY